MPAVTAKPPGSSARQTPSGSAWARSASRSTTPATKPRWRRFAMRWATTTLNPRGPRAPPCPSRRRSPTRSAAAANANAPTSGWASLTPTERDVVRLVSEGLGNKDIATRLFVSPRTVQTHLTHVYTKLSLTSRDAIGSRGGSPARPLRRRPAATVVELPPGYAACRTTESTLASRGPIPGAVRSGRRATAVTGCRSSRIPRSASARHLAVHVRSVVFRLVAQQDRAAREGAVLQQSQRDP